MALYPYTSAHVDAMALDFGKKQGWFHFCA